MPFQINRRIPSRSIQISKRNVPVDQIIAIEGQSPVATGIETAGNAIGQALLRRAQLRAQGEALARAESVLGLEPGGLSGFQDTGTALKVLEAKVALMKAAKEPQESQESYTIAGTDQAGNVIQVGNKSGKTRVIPVPGGGRLFPKNETPLTPENAGKLTMLQLATKDIDDVEGMIIDKDGTPNYSLIASANAPFGGLPFTKGRDVNSLIENSIAAKLRAETGATANESEVKSISRRFKPTVRDHPDTIKNKLARLREFMTTAIATVDPRGTRLQTIGHRQPVPITPARLGRFQIEVEE